MMSVEENTIGRIHSIETCGTVDGPGIRFVIFTQGCPLKCLYCHNPDSRDIKGGEETTVEKMMKEIRKYKSYMESSGGGVTISGGEPLIQRKFVEEILKSCKKENLHTALDTAGCIRPKTCQSLLNYTDLILLDIKSYDPSIYKKTVGVDIDITLEFASYLSEIKKETWIRFVLVPNLTDPIHNIEGLAKYISTMNNVTKVEILPFHKMGEFKWRLMSLENKLEDTPTPTKEQISQAKKIFKKYHLNVI